MSKCGFETMAAKKNVFKKLLQRRKVFSFGLGRKKLGTEKKDLRWLSDGSSFKNWLNYCLTLSSLLSSVSSQTGPQRESSFEFSKVRKIFTVSNKNAPVLRASNPREVSKLSDKVSQKVQDTQKCKYLRFLRSNYLLYSIKSQSESWEKI